MGSCLGYQQKLQPIALEFIQVDARFLGHGVDAFGFQSFNGSGGKTQTDKAIAFGPPNPFPLQICLL